MPRKNLYARIAISLPPETLDAADRYANALDRSRSWVIAEAVRAYTTVPRSLMPPAPAGANEGIGPSRLAQLKADLRLTPEERVKAAEETARATPSRQRGRVERVVGFDRYEDYLEYKRRDGLGG